MRARAERVTGQVGRCGSPRGPPTTYSYPPGAQVKERARGRLWAIAQFAPDALPPSNTHPALPFGVQKRSKTFKLHCPCEVSFSPPGRLVSQRSPAAASGSSAAARATQALGPGDTWLQTATSPTTQKWL